jgi:ubiquitin C-terminal hydrolase
MKYELFAISNHFGGLGGGHYTAYCRKNTEQWYEFDDSMVRPIGSERLVSSSSYVLFYRRLEGQVGGKV